MTPIRTVIIEDIPAELSLVKKLLATCCPAIEIVGETGKLREAINLITESSPDLLVMDIEITGGTSYDLLDQLARQGIALDFEIIFMTGHKHFDYATTAFAYSAIDFLTKPIDAALLEKAVQRASQRLYPEQRLQQLQLFMDLVRSTDNQTDRMAIHLPGGVLEFIDISKILYLEADGVMTNFIFTDTSLVKAVRSLGQYTQLLQQSHSFFSISNSVLINLNHMLRYNHQEKAVTMTNGKVLYAARRGGQDLRNYITRQYKQKASSSISTFGLLKRFFRH